jgi:hypothetical protein
MSSALENAAVPQAEAAQGQAVVASHETPELPLKPGRVPKQKGQHPNAVIS